MRHKSNIVGLELPEWAFVTGRSASRRPSDARRPRIDIVVETETQSEVFVKALLVPHTLYMARDGFCGEKRGLGPTLFLVQEGAGSWPAFENRAACRRRIWSR